MNDLHALVSAVAFIGIASWVLVRLIMALSPQPIAERLGRKAPPMNDATEALRALVGTLDAPSLPVFR
jgi:hypothetical protein